MKYCLILCVFIYSACTQHPKAKELSDGEWLKYQMEVGHLEYIKTGATAAYKNRIYYVFRDKDGKDFFFYETGPGGMRRIYLADQPNPKDIYYQPYTENTPSVPDTLILPNAK